MSKTEAVYIGVDNCLQVDCLDSPVASYANTTIYHLLSKSLSPLLVDIIIPPLMIPWIHFAITVPVRIPLAAHRSNHKIVILVRHLPSSPAFDIYSVGVDLPLRNES